MGWMDDAMVELRPWIGRVRITEDDIGMMSVRRVASTFDVDPDSIKKGDPLPPHWFGVFFGETMTQRKYESMGMFAWVSSPESSPRTTLHSAQVPTSGNNFAGQNYTGYSNPEMDDLIERVEVELDKAKDKNFWSVRVSGDLRLIVHKSLGSLLLCYVDHHDKAYDWAERRRMEAHPKTGAAQLVEIRETGNAGVAYRE